jgi:hypothetical protein
MHPVAAANSCCKDTHWKFGTVTFCHLLSPFVTFCQFLSVFGEAQLSGIAQIPLQSYEKGIWHCHPTAYGVTLRHQMSPYDKHLLQYPA